MDIVDRVIRGDFGNGEERKRRLGPFYGDPKRHNPFDYFWNKNIK